MISMIVPCTSMCIMWIGCIKWSLFNNICGCGSLDSPYITCPHTRPVHFNNSPLYDVLDVASVALFPNIVSGLAVYIEQSPWGDMGMKLNMRWGNIIFAHETVFLWHIASAAHMLWVQFPGNTHTDKTCVAWMSCKSLWIKASAKCINVNWFPL